MKKLLQRLLICYILIQPFMEIIYFYQGKLANIGPFTIPTLLRILLVGLMLLAFLGVYKFSKDSCQLVGYSVVVLLYLAAHIFLTRRALAGINDGFTYSLTQEVSYVLRVLFPVLVLFISTKVEFTKATLEKNVWWLGSAISVTNVLSNLFVVAVASYEKDKMIKGNFFTWFDVINRESFMKLASDGFFFFANTMSAIMILLLPLMIYYFFNKTSWWKLVLLAIMSWSTVIIGTRTAVFGAIASLVVVPVVHFFYTLLTDKSHVLQQELPKIAATSVMLLLIGLIYPFSPSTGRVSANEQVNIATENRTRESTEQFKLLHKNMQENPSEAKQLANNYVETHFDVHNTYGNVISKTNPIKEYPELWINVLSWPAADQVNFRKIEKANVDLLASQINKPVRFLFGISYVRMNYFIFNYERDFLNQFYSLGLGGIVLFVLPFVVAVIWLGLKFLFRREDRTLENFTYLFGFALFFGAAFLTGNVIDSITAGSIVAFLIGQKLRGEKKLQNSLLQSI